MKKYSKKMIDNYILGNEIDGYNITELENDKDFMMLVIGTTNDNKMYNLCSDELKVNYEFVKYLIIKFKNNIDFICEVADYYLAKTKEEINRLKIVIKMIELTNDNKNNDKYKALGEIIYKAKRLQIEMAKLQFNDENVEENIGMGFIIIYDDYNDKKDILDFYAKSIIEDIFTENNINLEKTLHEQFSSSEEIDDNGINNYMLNFIYYYDRMLSSYLSMNINLMEGFKNKIRDIQKEWNSYNEIIERKKYNYALERVHEYMKNIGDEILLTETDMLYYIGNQLGIIDKIIKYNGINKELYNVIKEEASEDFLKTTLELSPLDKFYYHNVINIVSAIVFDNSKKNNDNSKCKVLRVNFKKDE